VELKHGEPIMGTARWSRDECVGVTFDKPVDVLALLATSMNGPRPRVPRIEIQRTAWVREGATVHRARAVNISQGGVRIETPVDLTLGAEVIVTLMGLAPAPGTIRWKEEGAYGITFNRIIPLPALVAWLQEQREQLRAAG
jgi:hypothetical protein